MNVKIVADLALGRTRKIVQQKSLTGRFLSPAGEASVAFYLRHPWHHTDKSLQRNVLSGLDR